MPTVRAELLREFSVNVFLAAGVPEAETRTVSDCLVEANLTGHDSHGVLRIPSYVNGVRRGGLVPGAQMEVYNETLTSAKLDGRGGFGQVAMGRGMDLAIAKSQTGPIGLVTVTHCGHTGQLSFYALTAARQGRIGVVLLGGQRGRVAPYGGIDGRMYVNALSIAVPGEGEDATVLDMSVSATGFGKLLVQRARNEPCPEGWLIDGQGRPTTDPFADLSDGKGAILPLGGALSGHKGSGLAFMISLLCGLAERGDDPGSGEVGHLLMAIDVAAFLPLAAFQAQVKDFIRHVKTSRPSEAEVLVPGERASRTRRARLESGIPLEETTWKELNALADELGVARLK
ncbi:MAG: Ldh family oxidoreductase [Candidatus Latescibacteria bacterium]|nr:Ldh family oxidoreductase [Candidatus Latescibacterota bacterium]